MGTFLADPGMSRCLSDAADSTVVLLTQGWGWAWLSLRMGPQSDCKLAKQWAGLHGYDSQVCLCLLLSIFITPMSDCFLENSLGSTLSFLFLVIFWSRVLFTSWLNNCNGLCLRLHFTSFFLSFPICLEHLFSDQGSKSMTSHSCSLAYNSFLLPVQLNWWSSGSLSKSLLEKRSHFCWRSKSEILGSILGFARFWFWVFGKVTSHLWNITFDIYNMKEVDKAGGPEEIAESRKSPLCVRRGWYKNIFWNLYKKWSRYSYHS